MKRQTSVLGRIALLLALALSGCALSNLARNSSVDQQSASTPPVQTFCLGRFLIDLPIGSKFAGGDYQYNFGTFEKPEASTREDFLKQVQARAQKLKSSKHDKEPSLLREIRQPEKDAFALAYWGAPHKEYMVEIEGRRWLEGKSFLISTRASLNKQGLAMDIMADRLSRLRPRRDDEIPTEPGYCFEGGFIADPEWKDEELLVTFHFLGMPDAYLSVHLFPIDEDSRDKPLLDRQGGVLMQLGSLAAGIHRLRARDRQIGPFKGQELLMTAPNSGGFRGHDFIWETQGEGTLERPMIEIELMTGKSDGKGNAQHTRLSDEQAIALWDSIVRTFRIRPTGPAPAKTSEAGPTPKVPLGSRIVTNTPCPQTGWWHSPDEGPRDVNSRHFFRQGESMPTVMEFKTPSTLERLRGIQPKREVITVWKLVAYEDRQTEAAPSAPNPGKKGAS